MSRLSLSVGPANGCFEDGKKTDGRKKTGNTGLTLAGVPSVM